jgi:cleavage and polyadenylation specificity factor subunit 4
MGHLRSVARTDMDDLDLAFDFEAEIDAKDALRKASLKADGHTSVDNVQAKGRHSQVCRHWLKNLCMKGDKCDYLHQYDPNRMPECLSWLKTGKCQDPDCTFRHVTTSERPECQRYRLGFCKYGPMCRSRHDRLQRM